MSIASPASAIDCGQTLTNQVANPAPFVADEFDVIAITAWTTGLVHPTFTLQGPLGQVPLNGSLAACTVFCISDPLPADGSYSIEVTNLPSSSAFDITLESISGSFDGASNGPPTPRCGLATDGTRTIACGETVPGTIAPSPAESDTFTFDAAALDSLLFTVGESDESGVNPVIRLFAPGGDEIELTNTSGGTPGGFCGGGCLSGALPANGTYTVVLWDGSLDQPGAYSITLEALGGTFNGTSNDPAVLTCGSVADGTRALACGETLTGRSNFAADSDTFTFNAMTDEVLLFTSEQTDASDVNPVIKLFAPGGDEIELTNTSSGTQGFCEGGCLSGALPDNGTYTVVLWDGHLNKEGTYSITLESISGAFDGSSNGPPAPTCGIPSDGTEVLECGATVSGLINFVGESDSYTFEGVAGEMLSFTMPVAEESLVDPAIRLFGPDGMDVALNGAEDFCQGICISDPLPAPGVYTLILWDGSLNQKGGYDLTTEALAGTFSGVANGAPTPVCGTPDGTMALFCGDATGGSIDPIADSDSYSFDAESGEKIAIRTAPGMGSVVDPVIRLFGPTGEIPLNGAALGSFCSGQCFADPLPVAGTYTVVIWDGGLDETGAYSIFFNGCAIPVDPTDAYLHVAATDTAGDAVPISLASRGIAPGDPINIARLGDFVDTSGGSDTSTELCGVFSASDALDVQSAVDRVQDALNHGNECVTAATDPDGEDTDVPEDFLISEPSASQVKVQVMTVPSGASHVFFAAPDEKYMDNSDPDGDFSVVIIPEPGIPALFGTGAIAVLALAERRSRRGRRMPS
jgi:hypothetical protein